MYPRTNYEMTEADLAMILDASKPTPCIMIGSYVPAGPQENANRAWAELGERMGFDYMTVRPIEGKGNRFFTAVPSETESQRADRIKRERAEARDKTIAALQADVDSNLAKIAQLTSERDAAK